MFKDYNMNQLVLPMNLEIKLQENDIAFHLRQAPRGKGLQRDSHCVNGGKHEKNSKPRLENWVEIRRSGIENV